MQKLSVKEKFGYGLGDVGSSVVFQLVANFIMYFYTDVLGIAAAAAGTLLLVVRLFDAVTDPIMGAIADRTKSRHGRYRPWLIRMAIPYCLLLVLAFSAPEFSEAGKLAYAYVTYILMMTIYTAINIPYSALGGVISEDPDERANVQSWRFGLAMAGGAIVAATTLPLVNILGGGNEKLGYTLATLVLGIMAISCFVACFFLTKERVQEVEGAHNTNVKDDVVSMLTNGQWWIVAAVTFLSLVGVVMRGSGTPYYVEYFLGDASKISLFLTAAMVTGIGGAMFAGALVKTVCKVTIMKVGAAGILIFHLAHFAVPQDGLYIALVLTCAANFFHMMFIPMVFSAVPDTVEYSQSKNGKGGMAMSYSGHLLALKFGLALGGAAVGWLLASHGYVPGQAQSDLALSGTLRIYAGGSVVAAALMLVCLHFYKLKKGWDAKIHKVTA